MTADVPIIADAALTKAQTLSGTITQEGTSTVLPNINIMVFDPSTPNTPPVYSAMTDTFGQYSITLPPGDYQLQFCPSPMGGSYLCEYYNNAPNFQNATTVHVTADAPTTIDAALVEGVTITGKVTEEGTSTAIPNVSITLYDSINQYSFQRWANTDSSGNYTLTGLPAGKYKLFFSPSTMSGNYIGEWHLNQTSFQTALEITVALGGTYTIDAALVKGGTITGKVIEEGTTTPIPNVNITLYDSVNQYSFQKWATSDSSGNYTIYGLPAGKYKLFFNPSTMSGNYIGEWHLNQTSFQTALEETVALGGTYTIDAALVKGGSISGKVTEEGTSTAIQGVNITVYDSVNQYSFVKWANTDSSGNYTVIGLPTGTFKIYFLPQAGNYLNKWHINGNTFAEAAPISVTAGQDTLNIDGQLPTGGILTGKVTPAGSSTGLPGIGVKVFDLEKHEMGGTVTDINGVYTINKFKTGNYRVYFAPNNNTNYAYEWYNDRADYFTADTLAITQGQTSTLDVELAAGGSISGRLTEAGTGANIANGVVIAYDQSTGTQTHAAITQADGTYTISGLRTTTYKVSFNGPGGTNFISEWYDNKTGFSNATPVSVTSGINSPNIDGQLGSWARISGKVTDQSSGAGLVGVKVNLYDSNNLSMGWTTTASDGSFSRNWLYPGSYKIEFDPGTTGGYSKEWYNNKSYSWQADLLALSNGQTLTNINAQLAAAAAKTISGYVKGLNGTGIGEVTMNGLPGSPKTDANGFYSSTVSYGGGSGWTERVTPEKLGFLFTPAYRDYSNLTTNQSNQNYTAGLENQPPLYDDFQSGAIDNSKWTNWNFVREIREVAGNRQLVSLTEAHGPEATEVNNFLYLKNPGYFDSLAATVTVQDVAGASETNPWAGLTGRFYNDGTGSPESPLGGEIQASLGILKKGSNLVGEWSLWKHDGTTLNLVDSQEFSTPIAFSTPYPVKMEFKPTSQQFDFSLGSETITHTLSGTIAPSKQPMKGIGSRVAPPSGTSFSGQISSSFDDVLAVGKDASGNAVRVTDDFSAARLDNSKYSNYEFVREIVNGKLVSKLRNAKANAMVTNGLSFKNPDQVNEIQTRAVLEEFANPNGATARARILGFFYNDAGDQNSSYQGDVFAQVELKAGSPELNVPSSARWTVAKFNDPAATIWNWTILGSGVLPIPINTGQPYDLYLKWDEANKIFTFKVDDAVAYYSPTTTIFPSNIKRKELSTTVMPPSQTNTTYDVFISATFDDVRIGPSQLKPADLAIIKADEPGPIYVGQNLTYTITVSNLGPQEATGVILTDALPSAVSLVSVSASQGLCSGPRTVTCSLGTINNGSSATVQIVVMPNQAGTITNTAAVAGLEYDPLTGNNSSSVQTQVTAPPLHPGDGSSDYRMVIKEVTAYGKAWKKGLPWPNPPNPISDDYLKNAVALWRNGEFYRYDPSFFPPWTPGSQTTLTGVPSLRSILNHPILGIEITREIPSSYTPLVPILIKLTVIPDQGIDVYAVEELPPAGWTILEINEDGVWDDINKKVKWGPFFDDSTRVLTYKAIPPAGESGEKTFSGTTSSDGSDTPAVPIIIDAGSTIFLPLIQKP